MTEKLDSDYCADELVRLTSTVASKIRILADRLERYAPAFRNPDARGGAAGVAADIVSDYIQGCGSPGTFLWSIVRDAGGLDLLRSKEKSE